MRAAKLTGFVAGSRFGSCQFLSTWPLSTKNSITSIAEESDRMGKSTFAALEELKTVHSKSDISALKVRLRELNIEIVDLENQADPATR
ncbi:hypothetical protein VPK21_001011 (plasmid) [Sinorhizobium kummerowiae]|uniref:Uncharacterized protein n=1 Tax=Sinorhizobium kummerowiae TaxID=158892 RepID=A0ABY8TCZ2_9HYPH|nr:MULTISPECIES: hypothetical protein [Sinorhizobium]MDW9614643.1 hypothetical protein [Sinorhizobium meliloti]MDW9837307.1 hypothetical protein [Sinorhizobium meliloti]MDX0041603.1 hypothetical protein [Sinorhizobium meliloti]MDX0090880.1 hypothetical protein [Sinorhizobium meliloti]RVN97303.1 hypothetical protein CN105_01125 [Sinorhizobium meliloti]